MAGRWLWLALWLAGAVVLVAWLYSRPQPDWDFVQRVTRFDFPAGTKRLAQYDNAEWFVVSVAELPEGTVRAFARVHGFRAREVSDRMESALALSEEYRTIPARPDVLAASGRTDYQAWTAVLDPSTRRLWIDVQYPDWSGDHSGTAPQPHAEVSPVVPTPAEPRIK